MSTESIDRTRLSTVDQVGPSSTTASPFFVAAIATTIALVALGALVALFH